MAKDRFHEYPKSVLVGVGLFLSVAALFIVALRLFVRSRLRANVGIDDYFIVVAVVRRFSLYLALLKTKGERGKDGPLAD